MKEEFPDKNGYFKINDNLSFGGRFVPETLMPALLELEQAYYDLKDDKDFNEEVNYYLHNYAGRPTPLYFAENLSKRLGPKIYLKREDLCHTGAHKINNTIAQALLAKRMKKTRIIAETGAGQHGVATATACKLLNLECVIYMGSKDVTRQRMNVFRMELLGAKVVRVYSGSQTLKDAINEAIRDWVTNVRNTHYIIGSVVGPHPYPMIVRDFQAVIGKEIKEKLPNLPDYLVACVGGGSNAIGLFYPFYHDKQVKMVGVEGGGKGINSGRHAASLCAGKLGILHGCLSYILQDEDGNICDAHSIAPGLDYPGVGPEHAYYKSIGRVEYVAVTDEEAIEGFHLLSEVEGIIPALESAHAIYYLTKLAPNLNSNNIIVVNLSGRGDKDIDIVYSYKKNE